MFRQARQNMPEDDFGALRSAVPNMDALLSAASAVGSGGGGPLEKGLSMAGNTAGGLGGLAELAGASGSWGCRPKWSANSFRGSPPAFGPRGERAR
ncbi:MAG: DUF2780 domain-containing protein [Desulfococcaceae bacterium]